MSEFPIGGARLSPGSPPPGKFRGSRTYSADNFYGNWNVIRRPSPLIDNVLCTNHFLLLVFCSNFSSPVLCSATARPANARTLPLHGRETLLIRRIGHAVQQNISKVRAQVLAVPGAAALGGTTHLPFTTPNYHCIIPCPCPSDYPLSPFRPSLLRLESPPLPLADSVKQFPSEGVEAIELINVLAEAEVLESSTFRNWKSFHAPRDMHDQKQDERPAPSRAFSLARAVLLDSREGRGVRNCVKTSERDGLRGGRFQPGAPRCVPSITYARPKLVLATNTKAGLAIAGPGFHPVSSVPPAGTAMHFSCPSHARCRQAGEL